MVVLGEGAGWKSEARGDVWGVALFWVWAGKLSLTSPSAPAAASTQTLSCSGKGGGVH